MLKINFTSRTCFGKDEELGSMNSCIYSVELTSSTLLTIFSYSYFMKELLELLCSFANKIINYLTINESIDDVDTKFK